MRGSLRVLLFHLIFLVAVEVAVAADRLPAGPDGPDWPDWNALFNQNGGQKISFGVKISGPSPYERNLDLRYSPASNTKLFTAGALLEGLGAEARFETRMEWRRVQVTDPTVITQLRLIGSGDPSWGLSELGENLRTRIELFTDALMRLRVREIRGVEVLASDPRWDELRYPQGWDAKDYTSCDGALAQAFNLDINCGKFIITGRNSGYWEESTIPIPVTVHLRYGSQTQFNVDPVMVGGVAKGFVISGTLSSAQEIEMRPFFYLPIHDTKNWIKNLLIESLKQRGIAVHQPSVAEPMDGAGIEFSELYHLEFHSPTIAEILKPFLKVSLNVLGDAFVKILGHRLGDGRSDLLSAGLDVMWNYYSGIEGVGDQVTLWDGSGLSRTSVVTPKSMMALLEYLRGREEFPFLWEALAIAGVDGTLGRRMKNTAADGVLRGKTGTLKGVANLSGYVPRYQDGPESTVIEFVPFVILSKALPENEATAKAIQDRVGATLTETVNPRHSF